jgi:hypothetical protein
VIDGASINTCIFSLLNSLTMKTKLFQHLVVVVCLLAFQNVLSAQECPPKGNCGGDCAPWYFRNGSNVLLAGTPSCHKVKTEKIHGEDNSPECHCVLIHTATLCVPTGEKKDYCDGSCPPVFPTQQDAINNTNAIEGECITQGTGNNIYCACRYIK